MESLNTIHGINPPFKLYGAEVQWCTSVIAVPGRLDQDWKLKDSWILKGGWEADLVAHTCNPAVRK